MRILRRPILATVGAMLIMLIAASFRTGWISLWVSPDEQGRWLLEHGRFADAANAFADPMWRGVALMKAGSFKEAAAMFGSIDTPEAAYDQGNALVMLGQYDDAIARYERALALRPNWSDALNNRELARIRAARLKTTGGEPGEGDNDKPDSVVFEKGHPPSAGSKDEAAASPAMSDEEIRALWLKRISTQPADFLRARFAYQLQSAPP
jgi:Ca-activated chloride channel family protein